MIASFIAFIIISNIKQSIYANNAYDVITHLATNETFVLSPSEGNNYIY